MARATNIYLIRRNGEVVSAHTVKYEAHEWAERNGGFDELTLSRIADGRSNDKTEKKMEWDK